MDTTQFTQDARTMNSPAVLGQQLALLFKSCICVPELSLQDQAARSRRATGVRNGRSILARVERRLGQASRQAWESIRERKLPCSKHHRRCRQNECLKQPRAPGHRERSSPLAIWTRRKGRPSQESKASWYLYVLPIETQKIGQGHDTMDPYARRVISTGERRHRSLSAVRTVCEVHVYEKLMNVLRLCLQISP